jgi:ribosomal protein S18 acetylase RimI-like enzyme
VLESPEHEVIACGGVLKLDEGTARLRRFRVAQQWRRRGLATRLLLEAERFGRDHGLAHVTLGTTDEQRAAQALYRKHGYVEVGERWLAPDMREIEFAKDLA